MKRFWKWIVPNNCSDGELFASEMAAVHDAAAHPFATVCIAERDGRGAESRVMTGLPPAPPSRANHHLILTSLYISVKLQLARTHARAHKDERAGALCRAGHTLRLSSCRLAGAKQSNPIPPLHVSQSHAPHEVRVWREAYHKQRPHLTADAGEPPEPPQPIKG